MLQLVPEHLAQVAISIETLLDVNLMSVEEVTGRLRAVEQRRKAAPVTDSQGRLLLCEEEWRAKLNLRDSDSKSSSSGSSGAGGKKRGGRGRGRGRGKAESSAASPGDGTGAATRRDQCKRCGKYGHWAKDCRSKPKAEAHVAQAEEENEPALLMAHATVFPNTSTTPHAEGTPSSLERRPLRVLEGKVFAQLDGDAEHDDSLWYLDSGATNHMTGCRDAFTDIDTAVHGSVKFGDGSEVTIEGAGTVLFEGKTGEHLPLTGVYFIPRLTINIVSLGQLDEGGCDVHARHGLLRIRNEQDRLIVRVRRSSNRLYLLRVKLARPLCLAARASDSAWPWHERFGHLNFDALRKLEQRGMVEGLPSVEHVHQLCADYVTTKLKRSPFPSQAKRRAEGLLDLVHGDLCGPITPATPGGKAYFLLLVDDRSRYMWVALLAAKSDTLAAVKKFQA